MDFFYSFIKYLPRLFYWFVFLWSWNFWIVLPRLFSFQISNRRLSVSMCLCLCVWDFFVLFILICILCDVYPILFLYVIIYIVVMSMASVPLCMVFSVLGFPSPINILHYPFHCLCVSPFFLSTKQTRKMDCYIHAKMYDVLWPRRLRSREKFNETKNGGERERACVCEFVREWEKKLRNKNKIQNNCSCVGLSVCLLACLPAHFNVTCCSWYDIFSTHKPYTWKWTYKQFLFVSHRFVGWSCPFYPFLRGVFSSSLFQVFNLLCHPFWLWIHCKLHIMDLLLGMYTVHM